MVIPNPARQFKNLLEVDGELNGQRRLRNPVHGVRVVCLRLSRGTGNRGVLVGLHIVVPFVGQTSSEMVFRVFGKGCNMVDGVRF